MEGGGRVEGVGWGGGMGVGMEGGRNKELQEYISPYVKRRFTNISSSSDVI